MNLVTIVVPIYTNRLNYFEQISLKQLNRILPNYKKVFIAPKSLNLNLGTEFSQWDVVRFADKYFKNTLTYSELLLSVEFYEQFIDYKYMLIYQTDALVFDDKLKEFCAMDYDYIGAPWNYTFKMINGYGNVGNGGLSLRKISSVISLLQATDSWRKEHENSPKWYKFEDQFFAYCSGKAINGFTAADSSIAASFSFDINPRHFFKRNKNKLPFGCHGWYKLDLEFYSDFLEAYGYDLKGLVAQSSNLDRQMRLFEVVRHRCKKYLKDNKKQFCVKRVIDRALVLEREKNEYALWGYGDDGEVYVELLKKDMIPIKYILERDLAKIGTYINDIKIIEFNLDEIINNNVIVLLASNKHMKTMKETLLKAGLIENKNFINLCDVMRKAMFSKDE